MHMETIIPEPWLASLEHKKAHCLSKDYFPVVFQSFLAPTPFNTEAVQNNLSLSSFCPSDEGRIFSLSTRITALCYLHV